MILLDLRGGFPTNLSVEFHEVDSMKIVHHSYYINWMEKARFNFATSELGLSKKDFCELDFSLPVTRVESKYIRSATFGQNIIVYLRLVEREEAIVTFHYEMWHKEENVKLFYGITEHVFLDRNGKLLLHYPERWLRAIKTLKTKKPSYIINI